ncbi:hypothetical protein [Streptomyces sp. cmx-4-9]|uniref:hypothetical protein n=1 Tax=Streptomyces sp. cmx-4-9 TaxID=2790941 RepID=UPI00397EA171
MPKGIYDRAASQWQPPPTKDYDPELVAKVRELYEAGHTMREVAQLTGTTHKVLQRLMPRHGIARRKAIKRDQSGENNPMWKGEAAGYQALHLRVESVRGKPNHCQKCGTSATDQRYEWANLTGRYGDVSDYQRLCVPCHRKLDSARRAATGRRTSPIRKGSAK